MVFLKNVSVFLQSFKMYDIGSIGNIGSHFQTLQLVIVIRELDARLKGNDIVKARAVGNATA